MKDLCLENQWTLLRYNFRFAGQFYLHKPYIQLKHTHIHPYVSLGAASHNLLIHQCTNMYNTL